MSIVLIVQAHTGWKSTDSLHMAVSVAHATIENKAIRCRGGKLSVHGMGVLHGPEARMRDEAKRRPALIAFNSLDQGHLSLKQSKVCREEEIGAAECLHDRQHFGYRCL